MKIVSLNDCNYTEDGNLFTSRSWLSVLEEEYKFDIRVAIDDRAAAMPLLIFSPIEDIFGKRIISLPFSDYTEPACGGSEKLKAVLEFVRGAFPDHALTLKYHGEAEFLREIGFENIRQAFCHRIPLEGDIQAIWKRCDYAFRKGVNKAKASGLTVRPCNDQRGLDSFYQMLTDLRRNKFHALPQSKSFYDLFLKHFIARDHGNLWCVFRDNLIVGAAFVLHSGNALFDKMGVSNQEYLECRPNNLLLWEVMQYGNSRGMQYLDMGLTPANNAGLLKFKDLLGGVRTPINYYRAVPPSFSLSNEQEVKSLLTKLTQMFVDPRIPDGVVQEAGKMLYKYFC